MALLSHSQGYTLAALLGIFPWLLCPSGTPDAPTTTYRTGVAEVRIPFFATDENNQVMRQVSKDDFAVVDDGAVIRDFRSLLRANETSLDLVVMVDASESVTRRFANTRKEIAGLFSPGVLAPEDAATVISFAGMEPTVLCSGNCEAASVQRDLADTKAAGTTPLYDSLVYCGRMASSRHKAGVRQAVILFSDGNDTVSISSARDAMDAMVSSGAVLYSVNMSQSGNGSGTYILRQIAEATGGRALSINEGAQHALQTVLSDLHSSYVVSYPLPSRSPGFHSLLILPKHNQNLRFHCRRGYFYETRQ
jgi:VWFA-related protein